MTNPPNVDPLIWAAHGREPSFSRFLDVAFPPEVQARGYTHIGVWRAPMPTAIGPDGFPDDRGWRSCSYCGSIHPLDFLGYITTNGVSGVSVADWKYGFPHKIYLDLPNPLAGQLASRSLVSEFVDGVRRGILGKQEPEPATAMGKFYTFHFMGLEPEVFQSISAFIEGKTGIRFSQAAHEDGRPGVLWQVVRELSMEEQLRHAGIPWPPRAHEPVMP